MANRAAVLEKNAVYRSKNPGAGAVRMARWRANNPAKAIEADRNWRTNNRLKVNAKAAQYRAAKLKATPKWADPQKIEEFYLAADFLSMVTGEWYHVDHIVPVQGPKIRSGPFKGERIVCGLHCEANLQVLPGFDNYSKNNRYWPDMP